MNPDPRLLAAARLIENLARKLPAAREHVAAQLNALGQLHATTYDGTRGGERTIRVLVTDDNGNPILDHTGQPQYDHVPVTTIEDYAIQRLTLDTLRHDLEQLATQIAADAATALHRCDHLIGTRIIHDVPRCNTTGRDGAIEWADPTCTNIATRGPLCDRCSKREFRWRQRHGLPSRKDGVFSAPARGQEGDW